ncbi:MAG: hypothetical protein C4308_10375 [Chitinophagaceae bacterium]
MNKKTVFALIGGLALIAALAMYIMGNKNSHLTELQTFWWIPLPVALIYFVAASMSKTQR